MGGRARASPTFALPTSKRTNLVAASFMAVTESKDSLNLAFRVFQDGGGGGVEGYFPAPRIFKFDPLAGGG